MADNKYLDYEGLAYFWEKAKTVMTAADNSKVGYIEISEGNDGLNFWNFEPTYDDKGNVTNGAILIKSADNLLFEALKDGMLENVSIIEATEDSPIMYDDDEYKSGKFIEFDWNADGGNKKVYLKVDEIGKVYQGSETITINDATNKIEVNKINDEKVDVTGFKVGGTPLGDYLKEHKVTYINSGNLETVLKALFSDEKYPESSINYPETLNAVSVGKPTITLSKPLNGIVMAGTTDTLIAKSTTSSSTADITYSGFDYGYSLSDNDTAINNGAQPGKETITGTIVEGENYSLSFTTNNGFGNISIAGVTGENGGVVSQSSEVTYDLGTNKITVTVTSPSYTAEVSTLPAKYIVSSLGETSADQVVNDAPEVETISAAAGTSSSSITVTGVYPCYSNNDEAGLKSTVDTQLPLSGESAFIVDYVAETSSDTHFAFACPSGRTVTMEIYNTVERDWKPATESFTKTSTEERPIGTLTVDYDTYVYNFGKSDLVGASKFKFILSKKPSVA